MKNDPLKDKLIITQRQSDWGKGDLIRGYSISLLSPTFISAKSHLTPFARWNGWREGAEGDANSEPSNCPKYGPQTVDVLCKRRPAAGGAENSGNSQIPSTDTNFQRLEI